MFKPSPLNTTQRGYGYHHKQLRKQWAHTIQQQGGIHCWRCQQWINKDEPWHLGHNDHDRTTYQGPEHPHCNTTAAAKQARQRQTQPPPSQHW